MPLDGAFIFKLCNEMNDVIVGTKVDKVNQPSRDEIVITLRSKEFSGKLLLCVRPSSPRIQITEIALKNPDSPPMFCMLLRKHLTGARIAGIKVSGLERYVEIVFDAINDFGDKIILSIVIELIGNQANIIFVASDGRIIDAVRRSDFESSQRLIQPGASYVTPTSLNKISILDNDIEEISLKIIDKNERLSSAILSVLSGFSPLICREIEYAVCEDIYILSGDLTATQKNTLKTRLKSIKDEIISGGTPSYLLDSKGVPFDFSYIPITQYGSSLLQKTTNSYSKLLDIFYKERDNSERIRSVSADTLRLVNTLIARTVKKIKQRKIDMERCAKREDLRVFGELLKANIHNISRGNSFCDVQNYYDEQLRTVRIPLDCKLSPSDNAQKYFKDYKKACTAAQTLGELIAQGESELDYFESVLYELKSAQNFEDFSPIREELVEMGHLAKKNTKKNKPVRSHAVSPHRFVSVDGFEILVGRNNKQNDVLTLKESERSDLWLHVKNMPGSHTVIRCEGKTPPESTIYQAAMLAAYHSKASDSSGVPVDCTTIRNVKKPAHSAPGKVIYFEQKTYYITPDKELVEQLRKL